MTTGKTKHNGQSTRTVRVERRRDGQVWATSGESWVAVTVSSCFPWTEPTQYVSLRDAEDKEIALITDLCELDTLSREVIESALAEANFVFEIERVESIESEFEIRNWKVRTKQGPRTFQTEEDDWPQALPDGGYLIKDVAGDLFHVASLDELDADSRKLLWAFVD